MIFVTVGTQLPFDRLMKGMDTISRELGLDVVAQVHRMPAWSTDIRCFEKLTPEEFEGYFKAADVVVSHAGVGSIISARRVGRPIILYPRRSELGEHRNDHQAATARQLGTAEGIRVAWNDRELRELLINRADLMAGRGLGAEHEKLIANLAAIIHAVR